MRTCPSAMQMQVGQVNTGARVASRSAGAPPSQVQARTRGQARGRHTWPPPLVAALCRCAACTFRRAPRAGGCASSTPAGAARRAARRPHAPTARRARPSRRQRWCPAPSAQVQCAMHTRCTCAGGALAQPSARARAGLCGYALRAALGAMDHNAAAPSGGVGVRPDEVGRRPAVAGTEHEGGRI